MSVFDFDEYKQNHPTNLELIRFIESMDVEDVKLANRSDYNVIDSGEWLVPSNYATNPKAEVVYSRPVAHADAVSTDNINSKDLEHSTFGPNLVRLSKMVWMEKGRSDAMEIGKVSVISGHGVRAKTSKVIVANINPGDPLTVALDSDGIAKLAKATGSAVVKAICLVAPGQNGIGADEVIFELVD